jgi:hypothetical protein
MPAMQGPVLQAPLALPERLALPVPLALLIPPPHPQFLRPPRLWPPCRFPHARYKRRARHAAKAFHPYRSPAYS